jgi:Phytanoyl-CoA dioxygenase (PhyH)
MAMLVQEADCRAVTDAEVAHYAEAGWVKLPGFVAADTVAAMLALAKARMGEDAMGNAVSPMRQPFFNPEATHGLEDPQLRPVLAGMGAAARALQQRGGHIGVRYFGDFFAPKLPSARPTPHSGAGATFYHQDYVNWAVDRSGGMTFWMALEDITPDSGTMRFYSGSHRMGALGHYRSYAEGGGILEDYPELATRCTLSEPLSYAAGDVTVHSNLTVHGAGENRTDRPRWAYIVVANPSDVRWTGGVPEAFSTEGMRMLQPLDDARFPLIG